MTEFFLMYILLVHFLADFALQTDEQAKGKSSNLDDLTSHVWVYTGVWIIALIPFLKWVDILAFALITCVSHWITDYCSSRIGKTYWAKGDYHNGFVIVGADQILHYIQLYLTLKYML